MKTKLLKKVRKRYSIERIDFVNDRFISDNPSSMITYYAQQKKYPIYRLIDNIGYDGYVSIDYSVVYNDLLKSIRRDYSHGKQSREIIIKKSKIWWNK